jgi:branched-chain amino acid aminotransferase
MMDFTIHSVAGTPAGVLRQQADGLRAPIAWRGSEMMGVSAQTTKIHLSVSAWDWGSYFPMEQRLKGIRLTLAQYRRPDPATAPAKTKAAGLYMICTIEKHRAERMGYADALMYDWRGRVAECTGANIFDVKDGALHTPTPDCFLDGITRRTVIGLAKRRGLQVVERVIMPDELGTFSECFIVGTAAEVTPVSDRRHKYQPSRSARPDQHYTARATEKVAAE